MPRFVSPMGEVVVETQGPWIFRSRVTGDFDEALLPPFVRALDDWIGVRQNVFAFHDWGAMTGYDTRVRVDLTRWTLAHRKQFTAIHLFVRSKMVALGVHAANVALGGFLRVHGTKTSLDAACEATRSVRPL